MAQPRIPITTIRYKTFVKQTVVSALRTVFTNHPDAILAGTKTTIDFPFTEAEYPAVVVRFYERTIKNAGVGHEEYLSSGELVDQGTWFDPFVSGSAPFRSVQDYKVVTGSYPASGTLTTTNFKVIPLKPTQAVDIVTGQRSHVRVNRVGSEAFTIRSSLATSTVNSVSFVAEVVFGASNVILRLIYIDGAGVETVLGTTTLTAVAATSAGYKWISFHLEGDGTLRCDLMNGDPFAAATTSIGSVSATATAPQLATLTPTNIYYALGGFSAINGTSKIDLFRTLKTKVEDQRAFRYKKYFYDGDVEVAIYALSSYDRDLISDTIVQTLAMGDVADWTSGFTNTINDPGTNPSVPDTIDHVFTLNTDQIQGFGETQVPAPWLAEDVMVYQTSYRLGIFGEFYSPVPNQGDGFGLVEIIETYPYQDGDTVPTPDWSGPDHAQGTSDDVTTADPWA